MTYADVLKRLVSARRFGVVFGLERMRSLLDRLGSPDTRMGRVIHVGGTNGKGSTVAMIAHIARTAGLRVAAYTSPHLNELRERIAIDGSPIRYDAFVAAAEKVSAAHGDELTFFEQVTAIACVAIAEARVHLTVLEVGLGGRLDATNAIAADVAVVTGVAMDHEAILGDTIEKIAAEKAGIFKRDQRIVIGASGLPAAVPVLVEAARAVGVYPVVVDAIDISRVPPVALAGSHQRANAACAIAAVTAISDVVVPPPATRADEEAALARADRHPTWVALIDRAVQTRALASVVHPGRFEIVPDAWIYPAPAIDISLGDVILDGAHNPHGCAVLADTLREKGIRPTVILAVSSDKDVRAMLRALLPAVGDVIVTQYGQERAMPIAQLAAIVEEISAELGPITWPALYRTPSVTEPRAITAGWPMDWALYYATKTKHPADILIAGSLFLVGEARQRLLGVPTDPFIATDPAVRQTPDDDFERSG